jgi:hypothetical protein
MLKTQLNDAPDGESVIVSVVEVQLPVVTFGLFPGSVIVRVKVLVASSRTTVDPCDTMSTRLLEFATLWYMALVARHVPASPWVLGFVGVSLLQLAAAKTANATRTINAGLRMTTSLQVF